jgi:hypothetical protein
MRYAAIVLLTLSLWVSVPAIYAADQAVNTICPVTGKKIDSAIPGIIVTLGKGEKSQRLVIGVADADAAAKVKSNPNAYVSAAKANKKAE